MTESPQNRRKAGRSEAVDDDEFEELLLLEDDDEFEELLLLEDEEDTHGSPNVHWSTPGPGTLRH